MDLTLALAFTAGLLSFVSPCVLALVPVYLAFLGESAAQGAVAGGPPSAPLRSAVLAQAGLFILGFSIVFVVLGISVGLIGQTILREEIYRQVAGLLLIVLGVLTTGVFGPVWERIPVPVGGDMAPAARPLRALSLGALVAIGWTPCIGPVLGAILTMGLSSADVGAATLLLIAYSLGLAVPFLLAAIALPRMRPLMTALRRHHRIVQLVAGVFIILIGVLVFTNQFTRLASLFTPSL